MTVPIILRIDIGFQKRVESLVTRNGGARPGDEENRTLTRYVDPSERCQFQNDDRQPTQAIGQDDEEETDSKIEISGRYPGGSSRLPHAREHHRVQHRHERQTAQKRPV